MVDEADELYGLPDDEFTSARDALAKRLRGEKRREEADEVKALRRPSVAAGAINRAVREHGADDLLEAGEALREAHEALLSGSGDAAAVREATAREREAVRDFAAAGARRRRVGEHRGEGPRDAPRRLGRRRRPRAARRRAARARRRGRSGPDGAARRVGGKSTAARGRSRRPRRNGARRPRAPRRRLRRRQAGGSGGGKSAGRSGRPRRTRREGGSGAGKPSRRPRGGRGRPRRNGGG